MVSWIRKNPYCLWILICFSLLLFFPNVQVAAQQKRKSDLFSAQASILSKDEIEIDGKLEEASWAKASVLTNFTQQNPKEGAPATEKTEVRILYSKDFLYVGVRVFDSEPEKIKAILARRDSSPPSDWIRIWIDSYHDHRTAFEFAVNPSGVKRDVSWTDDSKTDEDWDAVWDVEVSLDEEYLNFLRKAAYAGGFDFRHRWANDTYEVSGDFIWSHILGSRESILLAQQSSARYFQRPDATHIEVDPTRTSLSGFSSSFSLSKIGGGHWRWSMAGLVRSPGFEVNDMGYLMYADWINQTTTSLTLRMNCTLAPNLSLQLYSQPYVSGGKYGEFKEVVHPRAKNYRDRCHIFRGQEISFQDGYYHLFLKEPKAEEFTFENPNFRQFRLNLVIRWEYLPGSILFLVWSSGINDNVSDGTFSLKNDLQCLFRRASNNVFLLKISYWFNI